MSIFNFFKRKQDKKEADKFGNRKHKVLDSLDRMLEGLLALQLMDSKDLDLPKMIQEYLACCSLASEYISGTVHEKNLKARKINSKRE